MILLWVVCVAGELALAAIQVGLDAEGHQLFFMASWTFGNVFVPVIGFGLVMGLQDDDPVTDGDAFWMTRPITGGRLLSAKALVLVLFRLVPVAVTIPFWMSHDFSMDILTRSSVQVLWRQALISLLALPFAVISSSGANFVKNTLVGGCRAHRPRPTPTACSRAGAAHLPLTACSFLGDGSYWPYGLSQPARRR